MKSLLARFRQYPLALQMLISVLTVTAAIILWHDSVWKVANYYSQEADQFKAAMSKSVANDKKLTHASIKSAMKVLGEKQPLVKIDATKADLGSIINKVLSKHKVSGRDVSEHPSQKSGRSTYGVVATKVRFESTPAEAYSIINQLETHKAVETISSIRIGKSADPRSKSIVVLMTVEGWYTTKEQKKPTTGTS